MICNYRLARPSVVATIGAIVLGSALAHSALAAKMSAARVYFEQNATDGDAEVVFSATSGRVGFATLKVTAPDKRVIVDFRAPDSRLGLRHIDVESPEPEDIGAVKHDYPEGEYTFAGTTVAGTELTGTATLSHEMPPVAQLTNPPADSEDVGSASLVISWKNPGNMDAIIVVVEQEDSGLEVTAALPGDATKFAVPVGFLKADTEYKVSIGTVAQNGNKSFIEAEFRIK